MNSPTLTCPSSNSESDYNCPRCKDTGIIPIDANDTRDVDCRRVCYCSCQEQKQIEKLFESSQITPAFRQKTLENYTTDKTPISKDMLKCGKLYLENYTKGWLVLLGEPGSGKTHISIAVGNELIKQGVSTLYFQHVEGMKEITNLIHEDKLLTGKINAMKQVDFLIWDDLFKPTGDKFPTPFTIDTVFNVLNYRCLNELPTAINSERTAKELLAIDKAVGSRIIEKGKGFTVTAEGLENNYRLI